MALSNTANHCRLGPEASQKLPEIIRTLRKRKNLSRGQIAKRLKVSEPTVYNIELGRTRITLGFLIGFLRVVQIDFIHSLSKNIFSIQNLKPLEEACQNPSRQLTMTIFKMWRERLKVSQKELSHALGFKSASMIHHFEKGLREASFEDFLNLMILSDDNVQGFIFAITQDAPLSNFFPGGNAQSLQEWDIYWSHHFISAVRQLMRTDTYRNLNRYKIGYFSKILNITEEQEHFALSILGRLGIAILNNGKPEVNPNVKILVPHNISNTVIKDFKKTWINQGLNRFMDSTEPADLLSLDLIPTNPKHLERITHLIRNLQNEIHNLDLSETNGFVCLGWMASFYRAENIIKA